ncbi:hypothetical protein DFH11DRAFT_1546004 [Phellopilus nigrolimitatus]|nr:hypothetical protein DFH11DRAFT_1546004 [Phellopilus nigrolimitatus]
MTWTTEPQRLFLEDVFAKDYHVAKKGGNAEVEALHEKTFEAYILRWPVETAQFSSAAVNSGTPQEIQQKKKSALQNRLRDWFKNKNRPNRSCAQSAPVLSLTGGGTKKPRKRMLQDIEAYNILYIKDNADKDRAFEADYAEHSKICKEHALEPVIKAFYKRDWLRNQYWAEPDELKELVNRYRKNREVVEPMPDCAKTEQDKDTIESDLVTAERQRLTKAAAIQKKVEALGATLNTIGKELEDQLGAKGFFFVALPEPKADGKLAAFKCSFGVTADEEKQDFEAFHPDFYSQVQKVACSWASKCIPKSVREEFSMTPRFDLDDKTRRGQETSARTDDTELLRDVGDIDLDDVSLLSIDPQDVGFETAKPPGDAKKPVNNTKRRSDPKLTEYELERLEKIKKREAMMESIGLTGPDGIVGLFKEKPKPKPRAKKAKESNGEPNATAIAPRRSSRNREITQDTQDNTTNDPAPTGEGSALPPDESDERIHPDVESASTDPMFANASVVSEYSSVSRGAPTMSSASSGAPADSLFPNDLSGEAAASPAPSGERAASAAAECTSGEPAASPDSSGGSIAPHAVPLASTVLVFDPASITDPRQKKAYAWIPEAEDFLRRHIKGDLADSLIKHWLEFEFRLGFPYNKDSSGRLPKQGRPDAINDWLKRARNYKKLPNVPPAIEYSAVWELWYKILQPPGPRQDADRFPPPQGDPDALADWSKLKSVFKRQLTALNTTVLLVTYCGFCVPCSPACKWEREKEEISTVLMADRWEDLRAARESATTTADTHTLGPLLRTNVHTLALARPPLWTTRLARKVRYSVSFHTKERAVALARPATLDHSETHTHRSQGPLPWTIWKRTPIARKAHYSVSFHTEERAVALARPATLDRMEAYAVALTRSATLFLSTRKSAPSRLIGLMPWTIRKRTPIALKKMKYKKCRPPAKNVEREGGQW